jgi:geranylgeranyl diphosphate synthase type I
MDLEQYCNDHFPDDWDTEWPDSATLEDGMEYALTSGGKRLRPILCLTTCNALGGDMDKAEIFARAVEVFHNFTLVHDDIEDQDRYRRGKKAVWEEFGLDHGINIGDSLQSLGYKYFLDNADAFEHSELIRLLQLYNNVNQDVIDGQALDFDLESAETPTEEEYFQMVEKKTGALIAAALKGACIIADTDPTVGEVLETYGNRIGPAFQIRDDIIDLTGKQGKRPKGSDIEEGKRSLIVVKALNKLDRGQKEHLLAILDKEKDDTSKEDKRQAIELFRAVDAIEETNSEAKQLADEAKQHLRSLPDEHDVSDLLALTDFIVERKF